MMTQDLAVCQVQCDSIDPFNLPSVSSSNLGALPEVTAVYFLIRKRCVLYVGKAKNLRKRWQGHHKKEYAVRFGDTQVAWAVMPDCAHALAAEKILIDAFMPQLNGYVPNHLRTASVDTCNEHKDQLDREIERAMLRDQENAIKFLERHVSQANMYLEQYIDNVERVVFYVQNDYQTSLRKQMAWLEELAENPAIHSSPSSCEIHEKWNDLMDEFRRLFNTFEGCYLAGDNGLVDDVQLEFSLDCYPVMHGFHKGTRQEWPQELGYQALHELYEARIISEDMGL